MDESDAWRDQLESDEEIRLRTKWQAVAYRIVGMGVAVEDRLDWCLAALIGRDEASVDLLYSSVAPTLSSDKKIVQLRTLMAQDPVARAILDAASNVMKVRNFLAHSALVDVSANWAHFEFSRRGRRHDARLWDIEAWLLVRGHAELMESLWGITVRRLEPEFAGRLLGYLEGEAGDTLVP